MLTWITGLEPPVARDEDLVDALTAVADPSHLSSTGGHIGVVGPGGRLYRLVTAANAHELARLLDALGSFGYVQQLPPLNPSTTAVSRQLDRRSPRTFGRTAAGHLSRVPRGSWRSGQRRLRSANWCSTAKS